MMMMMIRLMTAPVVLTVARILVRKVGVELMCRAVIMETLYSTTPNTMAKVTKICIEHTNAHNKKSDSNHNLMIYSHQLDGGSCKSQCFRFPTPNTLFTDVNLFFILQRKCLIIGGLMRSSELYSAVHVIPA